MLPIEFSENAWEEYLYWQTQDKKTRKRINRLIQEIARNDKPMGKAELLKNIPGAASVRIDEKNRLVGGDVHGDLSESGK